MEKPVVLRGFDLSAHQRMAQETLYEKSVLHAKVEVKTFAIAPSCSSSQRLSLNHDPDFNREHSGIILTTAFARNSDLAFSGRARGSDANEEVSCRYSAALVSP